MRVTGLLVTTAMALALPAAASAQSSPPAEDTASSGGLGDIIVTAQRRSESSQKAAVPLTVIDGASLFDAGVTQADKLNELTPALSVEPTSTGNIIFLRGVGNFTVTPTSDPAVAFNYDGVYVGRASSTTGVFYDLDRIEILKGPQGTLYGRNATGGAINILPMQPRIGEMSGHVSAAYGNYNTINAEGALNVPIGERAALRFSATTANHDGYLRDGLSDEKTVAFRLQLKAELTPDLTVRIAGDYAHNGGLGNGVSYIGRYVPTPAVAAPSATAVPGTNYYSFIPATLSIDEGVYTAAAQAYRKSFAFGPFGKPLSDLAPNASQNNTYYGLNAEIIWNTGAGTLTVIPSWRHSKLDVVSNAAAFIFQNREKDDQYSLEARFAGERVGVFDYTLGAYYYKEKVLNSPSLTLSNVGNFIDQKLTTESYAVFGRVVANLTDRFRVVGGLRYTKDNKGFEYAAIGALVNCVARNAFGAPNCPNAPLVPLFTNPPVLPFPFPAAGGAPIPVFTNPGPPGPTNPLNYLIIRTDSAFTNRLASSKVTYRGAVEFDLAPQSMVYASFETGYRSGGFSAALGFETYQPEFLKAYTIGMKNRFLDNRIQLNLEGFIWDYTNQQINHVGLSRAGTPANFTENVGASKIKGFEVEGRFLVTPKTLLSANIQYLDAKQTFFQVTSGPGNPPLTGCAVTFTAANASPYVQDCSGFTSYNSPRWTANLGGEQTIAVGDFEVVVGVETQYKGKRPIGFAYLPQQTLPGNWTTNAQISFGPAQQSWSIAAYIRNLENNRIPIYSSTHPSANILIAGTTAPRTYGVRAAFKF